MGWGGMRNATAPPPQSKTTGAVFLDKKATPGDVVRGGKVDVVWGRGAGEVFSDKAQKDRIVFLLGKHPPLDV